MPQKNYKTINSDESLDFDLSDSGYIDSVKYSAYETLFAEKLFNHPFSERIEITNSFISDMKVKEHYLFRRIINDGSKPVQNVQKNSGNEYTKMINLASNDYLNLSQHPRVIRAFVESSQEYGIGIGASPIASGTTSFLKKLEDKISKLKGTEKTIVYTSGYGANVGTISALLKNKDVAIMDSLCHASLIDGTKETNKLYFQHNDLDSLEKILSFSKDKYVGKLVILDGVYSMDGDIAKLDKILDLAHSYGAWVLVDEAHATGVIGETGGGTPEYFNVKGQIDIITGTLSKALGCIGGFVSGNRELINYLELASRSYVFSTAPIVPITVAALEAIHVMEEEPEIRERLWTNINYFGSGLKSLGFDLGNAETAIFPIIIGNDYKVKEMCSLLDKSGIMTTLVVFPAVARHLSRIRISLTAGLEKEHLDKSLNEIERIAKGLRII